MGERGAGGCRRCGRDERGQVVVLVALLLPMLLTLGALVIGVGNWYTHAKHLQTKVDAAAFAGGASRAARTSTRRSRRRHGSTSGLTPLRISPV